MVPARTFALALCPLCTPLLCVCARVRACVRACLCACVPVCAVVNLSVAVNLHRPWNLPAPGATSLRLTTTSRLHQVGCSCCMAFGGRVSPPIHTRASAWHSCLCRRTCGCGLPVRDRLFFLRGFDGPARMEREMDGPSGPSWRSHKAGSAPGQRTFVSHHMDCAVLPCDRCQPSCQTPPCSHGLLPCYCSKPPG